MSISPSDRMEQLDFYGGGGNFREIWQVSFFFFKSVQKIRLMKIWQE